MRVATWRFVACASAVFALAPGSARAADPLPSWNEGPSKKAVLKFVADVATQGGPGFVQPAERIATFDNDGTLWSEQPIYFQVAFALERVKALAPQHPEWKTQEPFKTLLTGDVKGALAQGEKAILEIMAATHTGMTTEEFTKTVGEWATTAKHPRFGRLYTEMVFQPMLELLAYLRANGFKTFIVSGGGVEFMRPWVEKVYGIPPEQVVGSSGVIKFEMRPAGPVLLKEAKGRVHRRRSGETRWHQPLHRPATHLRLRELRRRPSDAAVDGRRSGPPVHGDRPSHRRRARVGLRPSIAHREAGQGAR